tara:strand:+ start:20108 stop:20584 length:477 start_codon:yes stop_codon:yes gene_type:complete
MGIFLVAIVLLIAWLIMDECVDGEKTKLTDSQCNMLIDEITDSGFSPLKLVFTIKPLNEELDVHTVQKNIEASRLRQSCPEEQFKSPLEKVMGSSGSIARLTIKKTATGFQGVVKAESTIYNAYSPDKFLELVLEFLRDTMEREKEGGTNQNSWRNKN